MSTPVSGCYYVDLMGQAFGWTQVLPTLITLTLSILSRVTGESMFFIYGLYLQGSQFIIWAFQAYFQYERPNPICQQYHSYAFPSVEGYYAAALVTFVIAYSQAYGVEQTVLSWLILYVIAIAPPLILVWFSYNVWWEVLFSMLMATTLTIFFVVILSFYISPVMPVLLNMFPANWFGYKDRYFQTQWQRKEQQQMADLFLDLGDWYDESPQPNQ